MRFALALLAVLGTSTMACGGRAKSAIDWEHKSAFKRGTVLRHVPDECASGHVFLDLPAVEKNEASAAALDVLSARFFAGMAATPSDRRVLAALRDALKEEGLDPIRDTKEIALCLRASGGIIAVFGGDYSGKDVFHAFDTAAKKLGDKSPKVEVEKGVELISLGQLRVARVAPNVVAIGEDLSALLNLRDEADRSESWGYKSDLVGFARLAGEEEMFVSFADKTDDVEIELILRGSGSAKDYESRRDSVADRLGDTPLKALAPAARAAKINFASGFVRFLLRGKSRDIAEAIHTAAELSPAELKKILGYVFGGGGSEGPEHKI